MVARGEVIDYCKVVPEFQDRIAIVPATDFVCVKETVAGSKINIAIRIRGQPPAGLPDTCSETAGTGKVVGCSVEHPDLVQCRRVIRQNPAVVAPFTLQEADRAKTKIKTTLL